MFRLAYVTSVITVVLFGVQAGVGLVPGHKDCAFAGTLITYYINGANGPCWPGFLPFITIPEIDKSALFSGFTEDRYISGDEVATFIEVGGAYSPEGMLIGDLGPEDLFLLETVQIDVSHKASRDTDYEISRKDIEDWICEHGMIPPRAFVIFNTGWSFKRGIRYYGKEPVTDIGELDRVLNTVLGSNPLDQLVSLIPGLFQFAWPGLSAEAAEYLHDFFYIKGIGIDTPSVDAGFRYNAFAGVYPETRGVRRFLTMYGIFLVHNVLLLDIQLPTRGMVSTLGVFNMCKATRAPVNIYVEYCSNETPSMCCELDDYRSIVLGIPYWHRS